jgi:hypothetical protein
MDTPRKTRAIDFAILRKGVVGGLRTKKAIKTTRAPERLLLEREQPMQQVFEVG